MALIAEKTCGDESLKRGVPLLQTLPSAGDAEAPDRNAWIDALLLPPE